ncbi:MAG: protein rep [Planctomycetota bacterium]|jgi:hypothetical protein
MNVHKGAIESKAMKVQRRINPIKTSRLCSTASINRLDGVQLVKVKGSSCHFKGLMVCGNGFCVVCSKRKAQEHSKRVHSMVTGAFSKGLSVKFVTLTIPRYGLTISEKVDVLSSLSKKLINNLRGYCRRRGSELFSVKSLDVTINEREGNPEHLHLHLLVIVSSSLNSVEEYIWEKWKHLSGKYFDIIVDRKGYDCRDVDNMNGVSSYLVKTSTIGLEIASNNKGSKTGKNQGFLNWFISSTNSTSGLTARQESIYKGFISAIKGRRMIDYSRNWKELIIEEVEEALEEEEVIYSKRVGCSLWAAIVKLGFEGKIQFIVDCHFDKGIHSDRFRLIDSLMEKSSLEFAIRDSLVEEYIGKLEQLFE